MPESSRGARAIEVITVIRDDGLELMLENGIGGQEGEETR